MCVAYTLECSLIDGVFLAHRCECCFLLCWAGVERSMGTVALCSYDLPTEPDETDATVVAAAVVAVVFVVVLLGVSYARARTSSMIWHHSSA